MEDLVIESIQIFGVDVYYVPRTINNLSQTFTEDDLSTYESAHMVEMYVKNAGSGFSGPGETFGPMGGLGIFDSIVLTVARRRFQQLVGNKTGQTRPNEGDLIYFPLNKKLFKVMFVEHEDAFYQSGSLQYWDLKIDLFEYSGERFSTGLPDIDDLFKRFKLDDSSLSVQGEGDVSGLTDEQGDPVMPEGNDPLSDALTSRDNDYFENEGKSLIDFSEKNPLSREDY